MMPDLGKYATEVGLAYGVSLLLLAALIAQSWRASRKMKARLRAMEGTRRDG